MKKLLFPFILLLSITFSKAQETPKVVVESFFSTFESEGPGIALEGLYATNPYIDTEAEAIKNVRKQLSRASAELLGLYLGYEHIHTKRVTDDFYVMSYFAKFERQLLRFTFMFYKPREKWVIQAFRFDDGFDQELSEAMKLYYLDFNKS